MLAALLISAAVTACPVEQARYALRTEPAVTAAFARVDSGADWPAGLSFRIDTRSHRYWFLPFGGGTGGAQYLASTTDMAASGWKPPHPDGGPRPLGHLDYLGFDATYQVLRDVPRRGDQAPAHILLPELSDRLWHSPPGVERESVPRQFFDLVACAKP